LYGLAREGQAPKIFLKRNSYDVPWVALIVTILFGLLAYMTVGVSSDEVNPFG
jgi:yeast amino acid transporter